MRTSTGEGSCGQMQGSPGQQDHQSRALDELHLQVDELVRGDTGGLTDQRRKSIHALHCCRSRYITGALCLHKILGSCVCRTPCRRQGRLLASSGQRSPCNRCRTSCFSRRLLAHNMPCTAAVMVLPSAAEPRSQVNFRHSMLHLLTLT